MTRHATTSKTIFLHSLSHTPAARPKGPARPAALQSMRGGPVIAVRTSMGVAFRRAKARKRSRTIQRELLNSVSAGRVADRVPARR